jgi:hypothetical protein
MTDAEIPGNEVNRSRVVEAESTWIAAVANEPDASLESRKRLPFGLGTLKRVLALTPSPAVGPALRHPLEDLTFCNGTICRIRADQLGGEYMGLSGIELVRKVSLQELDDERCEYRFEFNVPPDTLWRWLFQRVTPGLPVRFEGRLLILTCLPSNLDATYRSVKQAIQRTNVWYARERERLIPRVIAQDEAREVARELEKNRRLGLQRQFESLPL